MQTINVQKLHPNAIIPKRMTSGACGFDLCACIEADMTLLPNETALIPTGLAFDMLDENIGGFIFARSGLSVKHGIRLANSVGVIDSDYRGEIKVALFNQSQQAFTITHGDRIAQMVFLPVILADLVEVAQLNESSRGAGGFGSTGHQ